MNKEFIPYEQALELKELGFDEPCFAYYDMAQEFNFPGCTMHNRNFINLKATMTPLYQQAFRWFREKYDLGHMINGVGFESFIMNIGGIIAVFPMFKTYEEAELACLKKLIEIVKKK
jgi:hypothetical protein